MVHSVLLLYTIFSLYRLSHILFVSVYILQQKLEKEFFENHLPRSLDKFEKILKSRGGKYFADNKVRTCGKSLSILETIRETKFVIVNYYIFREFFNRFNLVKTTNLN